MDKLFITAGIVIVIVAIAIILIVRQRRIGFNRRKRNAIEQIEKLTQQIEAIQRENEALEQGNVVKDKLLSIISHDLRSPISSLQVLLNMFNAHTLPRKDLIDFVAKMLARVENTINMLTNLLHWSQSQLNGISPSFAPTDINEIIENSVNFYRMQAEQKHITIANVSNLNVKVAADEEMLKIVLRNIISNSLKFTHEGGSITLDANVEGDEVIVSVKDTGVGISPENQAKMFGATTFSTLGTGKEKGTGLGLLLCKDFVEHNRGRLWLKSAENEGTTFFFSIPLAK